MTKYRVTWEAKIFATQTVDVDDENEDLNPIEESFKDGFPEICFQCAGWNQDYSVEWPDDPAQWDLVEVEPQEVSAEEL